MDNNETRQLITDLLSAHTARIESAFELINFKLNQIEKNNTGYNNNLKEITDRVTILEQSDKTHYLKCPMNDKYSSTNKNIDVVKEELEKKIEDIQKILDADKTIKKWLVRALTVMGSIATFVWTYLKIKGGM